MNNMQLLPLLYAVLALAACLLLGIQFLARRIRAVRDDAGAADDLEHDAESRALRHGQLEAVMQDALDSARPVALILLRVNGACDEPTSAGHAQLLLAAQRALERTSDPGDSVLRVGTREFALILRRLGSVERLLGTAWRALDTLNALLPPEPAPGRMHPLRAHAGIALTPRDGDTVVEIIARASSRVEVAIRTGYPIIAAEPGDFALLSSASAAIRAGDTRELPPAPSNAIASRLSADFLSR